MLSWFALTIKRGLKIVKLITKLLLALTMLVSTSAAQAFFENVIDSFDETIEICEDEVEFTGFVKLFEKDTGNRVNFSVNLVASGIGELGDIYSLTISAKFNLKESDNQIFVDDMLRVKVKNFDTGKRYWGTANLRFVANVGAGVVIDWDYFDFDACLEPS